ELHVSRQCVNVADRNPRIAAAHLLDHSGDESGSDELWRTNPDLARAAAREKLNVAKTLAQLIEYHIATLQKRISRTRSLDTVRTSVEQADAKSILELSDGLRDRRLRHAYLLGGLRHASPFNDRSEDLEIPQAQPAAEPTIEFRVLIGHRIYQ